MRRKRIIAKLLALSLVFSGLPMTSLQAAELPAAAETQEGEAEENPADDSQAEVENQETESTDHSDSAEQEKETQDGDNAADDTKQDASDESGTEQKEEETDSEKDENLENDGATQRRCQDCSMQLAFRTSMWWVMQAAGMLGITCRCQTEAGIWWIRPGMIPRISAIRSQAEPIFWYQMMDSTKRWEIVGGESRHLILYRWLLRNMPLAAVRNPSA